PRPGHSPSEAGRRVSGSTVGELLRSELAGPLGADFHIGLPDEEHSRVATLVQPPVADATEQATLFTQLAPVTVASLANPLPAAARLGGAPPAGRGAEIRAARGPAAARGVAAVHGVSAQRGTVAGGRYPARRAGGTGPGGPRPGPRFARSPRRRRRPSRRPARS